MLSIKQSIGTFKLYKSLNYSLLARFPNMIKFSTTSKLLDENTDTPIFDMENPYKKEKIQCILCKYNITPDYKNVKLLSQFQSPYTGKIYGRHITGLCELKQKSLEMEIRKAQNAGLMADYLKEEDFLRDPKLFDCDNPIRPHAY